MIQRCCKTPWNEFAENYFLYLLWIIKTCCSERKLMTDVCISTQENKKQPSWPFESRVYEVHLNAPWTRFIVQSDVYAHWSVETWNLCNRSHVCCLSDVNATSEHFNSSSSYRRCAKCVNCAEAVSQFGDTDLMLLLCDRHSCSLKYITHLSVGDSFLHRWHTLCTLYIRLVFTCFYFYVWAFDGL